MAGIIRRYKIFRKENIAFLIGLIGALGVVFSITTYFYDKTPELRFEVISQSNVLDVSTGLSRLEIMLDSVNLRQRNENIKILLIKVENSGLANITYNSYSDISPLGLTISNGYLIDNPQIIEANKESLMKVITSGYSKVDSTSIIFPRLILDKGNFFVIKLLIAFSNDSIPQIIPKGEISGQAEIKVIDSTVQKSPSFLHVFFYGNLWIQILRFLLSGIFFVLLLFLMLMASARISSWRKKRGREKLVFNFRKSTNVYPKQEFILLEYIKNGIGKINEYYSIVNTNDLKNKKKYIRENTLRILFNNSILIEDSKGNINIDDKSKNVITQFADFIESHSKDRILLFDYCEPKEI